MVPLKIMTRTFAHANISQNPPWVGYETHPNDVVRCQRVDSETYELSVVAHLRATNGGYQWVGLLATQIDLRELCNVSATEWALHQVLATGRDEWGRMLNHPPIHLHHFAFVMPMETEAPPGSSNELYLQTGELTCSDVENAITTKDCLVVNYKYPKRSGPVVLATGDWNDVRPNGSAPMRWRPHVTALFRPVRSAEKRPILWTGKRQVYMRYPPTEFLVSGIDTVPIPTNHETFNAYSFQMNGAGVLQPENTFHHVHHYFSKTAYLLKATPSQLGILDYATCLPFSTSKSRFANNAALARELEASPHLVCSMRSNNTFDKHGRHYDKRPWTRCKPVAFDRTDVFTSVDIWGMNAGVHVGPVVHEHNGWDVHYTTTLPSYTIAWAQNTLPDDTPPVLNDMKFWVRSDNCTPAFNNASDW